MNIIATFIFYFIIEAIAVISVDCIKKSGQKALIYDSNRSRYHKGRIPTSLPYWCIYIAISFLVLFLTLALRDDVGKDYQTYAGVFGRIGQNNLYSNEKEWVKGSLSFWLICKVLYLLGCSPYIMFAVVAFITLVFFYKAIVYLSNNWTFSLFLLISFCIYYHCFNEIRQMAAVAIVMYSVRYLVEEDRTKFILTILLAATFHNTCLVFLPVWFLKKIPINMQTMIGYSITGIVFYCFFNVVILLVANTYYGRMYINWDEYNQSFTTSTVINLFVRAVMLAFCLFYSKKTIKRVPHTTVYYHIAALCTILQLGAVRLMLFGRVTMYFYVIYILLIPEVVKTMKTYITKRSYSLLVIGEFLFFTLMHLGYYFVRGASNGGYLYYHFIKI